MIGIVTEYEGIKGPFPKLLNIKPSDGPGPIVDMAWLEFKLACQNYLYSNMSNAKETEAKAKTKT